MATYDFVLTFYSNQGTISYSLRDKRRFRSKIAFIPPPVYLTPPLKEFPLELGNNGLIQEMLGLSGDNKFDDILDTDGQTDTGRRLVPRSRIASRGKSASLQARRKELLSFSVVQRSSWPTGGLLRGGSAGEVTEISLFLLSSTLNIT